MLGYFPMGSSAGFSFSTGRSIVSDWLDHYLEGSTPPSADFSSACIRSMAACAIASNRATSAAAAARSVVFWPVWAAEERAAIRADLRLGVAGGILIDVRVDDLLGWMWVVWRMKDTYMKSKDNKIGWWGMLSFITTLFTALSVGPSINLVNAIENHWRDH